MMCYKEVHCGGPDKVYGETMPALRALLDMLHRQWNFLTATMARKYMFMDIKLGNILMEVGNVFTTCDYESIVCIDAITEIACCHSFLGLQSGLDGINASIDDDGVIQLDADCQHHYEMAKAITCGSLVAMCANVLDPTLDDLFLVIGKENIFTAFDPSHPSSDGNRLTDLLTRLESMVHEVQKEVKVLFYTLLANMLHQTAYMVSLGNNTTSPLVELELKAYGALFNAVTGAEADPTIAVDDDQIYLSVGTSFVSTIDMDKWNDAVAKVRQMASSICMY